MIQSGKAKKPFQKAILTQERKIEMKAVITVTGKDNVGIIAKVSALCSEYGANISDISQTVLSDYFAMIMLVDIKALTVEFGAFSDALSQLGKANHLDIHTMHEDIFNSMHRI
jgi:ACT domain-containing protein